MIRHNIYLISKMKKIKLYQSVCRESIPTVLKEEFSSTSYSVFGAEQVTGNYSVTNFSNHLLCCPAQ